MMHEKIKKCFRNPALLLLHMCQYWPFRCISDEAYLKLFFRVYQGFKLNLNNPETFNAKLQWLKLYDRRPKYTIMSDKYLVRDYVKETIGEDYLIPLLGVWDYADQIDFDKLPNQFVLKCNHDSGSIIVCTDKANFNKEVAVKKLNKALSRQYYWTSREWNYRGIQPRVIAEKYMIDKKVSDLKDYKFFCFDGIPRFIQLDSGRFTDHKRNFYTTEWEIIPVEYGCPNDFNLDIKSPPQLDQMMKLAKTLSKGMPHVRVDFYIVDSRIYFGELTFHHGGGAMNVDPFYYDKLWGEYLKLPEKYVGPNI